MKKILFFLLIATPSFAGIQYEGLNANDDGSVSVLKPKWTDSTGSFGISGKNSDLRALCKNLNYAELITWKRADKAQKKLVRFRQDYNAEPDNEKTEPVDLLVCSTNELKVPTLISTRYGMKSEVDNMNFEIIAPEFGLLDGTPLKVSSQSDMNGVCRLYGFEKMAKANPVRFRAQEGLAAVIGTNGSFKFFDFESNRVLESIRCVKTLEYRLTNPLDLDQMPDAFQIIAQTLRPSLYSLMNGIAKQIEGVAPIEKVYRARKLSPSDLTDAHQYRIAAFLLLEPVFQKVSSEWFSKEVRSVYFDERLPQITTLTGMRSSNDMRRGSVIYMTTASWILQIVLQDFSSRITGTQDQKWISQMIRINGFFLASQKTAKDLAAWKAVWDQGEVFMLDWLGNPEVEIAAQVLMQSGEWLKSCL